jgi:hypothetical protein
MVLVVGVALVCSSATAFAGPSVDVALIGSGDVQQGGFLPTSGAGVGDFNFSDLDPADVSAANLVGFDTVVLNAASPEMDCDTGLVSEQGKADLVAFVQNGGKMIIYDSECGAVDYSWLPFPFTTNNPGQLGVTGELTIVENNALSSNNFGDPEYIDAQDVGSETDAVGDANVMVTRDINWCLDMTATNANVVTGPAHTYARLGSGLLIYNGLDVDDMNGAEEGLRKIWVLELEAPFNPSPQAALPCGTRVAGAVSPAPAVGPAALAVGLGGLLLFGVRRLRRSA